MSSKASQITKPVSSRLASPEGIQRIFLLSGMAALIYQVAWQRMLMAIVGVDSLSIALIVAVFLAALGVGSLIGEWTTGRTSPRQGVFLFCAIECGIGLYGVFSTAWLAWIGANLSTDLLSSKILATTLAIAPPVTLMGMTLPILVEVLRPQIRDLHCNVGRLYAINAFGSGLAALATVDVIFPIAGLDVAVGIAAALNAVCASLVYLAARHWGTAAPSPFQSEEETSAAIPASGGTLAMASVSMLAMLTGFLIIGQEVVILRLMSWAAESRPWTFGAGVGAFLIGMAIGSLQLTTKAPAAMAREGSRKWAWTAACFFFIPAAAPFVGALTGFGYLGASTLAICLGVLGYLGGSSLTFVVGLLKSQPGRRPFFGVIYTANIIGSVAGSILVGYILFDLAPSHRIVSMLAAASLALALVFKLIADGAAFSARQLSTLAAVMLAGPVLLIPAGDRLYERWLERTYSLTLDAPAFLMVKETRTGIIAVSPSMGGDTILGGGVYDGRFNVDPINDFNSVFRPYLAMAMLPKPRNILEIGLSSGSWAKTILSFPSVQSLVSVDLNRGYLDIIRSSPVVADILQDPRLKVVVQDGRKFLGTDPRLWDAIIINASFHWREGATLLHSREFMQLAKSRLVPGGLLLINTTGADAIYATALSVFPQVWKVYNAFVAANGTMADQSAAALGRRLSLSNQFSSRGLVGARAEQWAAERMPIRLHADNYADCEILTDNSMATEWGRADCTVREQ